MPPSAFCCPWEKVFSVRVVHESWGLAAPAPGTLSLWLSRCSHAGLLWPPPGATLPLPTASTVPEMLSLHSTDTKASNGAPSCLLPPRVSDPAAGALCDRSLHPGTAPLCLLCHMDTSTGGVPVCPCSMELQATAASPGPGRCPRHICGMYERRRP